MPKCGLLIAILFGAIAAPAMSADVQVQTLRQVDGSATLEHEVVVNATPSEVWTAISTLDGWKTWSVPFGWKSTAGGQESWETTFDPSRKTGNPQNIRHIILGRVPGRLFVFKTVKAPASFRGGTALREVTWIIQLTPVGDTSTLVRLTGTGFARSPDAAAALSFFEKGNAMALDGLRVRFERGPRDWGARSVTGVR
jgi:uncharacterized protein YndB with AHSA1/START domain